MRAELVTVLHHRLRRRIEAAARPRLGAATASPASAAPVPAGSDPAEPDLTISDLVEGPWEVRRAGLVDINPIARMLQDHRPFIDLDGDGLPDEAPDPEQAGSATRLVLSHGAFEHGEMWFAQDSEGVAAVAVWMPPDPENLAAELHRAVSRELGEPPVRAPEPAPVPLQSIAAGASRMRTVLRESDAHRLLIMLSDAGRTGPEERLTLLADLLAPVATAELLDGRSVLAVTVDPAQVADLETLGFAAVGYEPVGAASLWLGALRPLSPAR